MMKSRFSLCIGFDQGRIYQSKCRLNSRDITLRPRQNGCHFPDDIFKCILVNGSVWISLKLSLKFVPKIQINDIPGLVQIMAWRRPGDKPLSEPMMVKFINAYMRHSASMRYMYQRHYDRRPLLGKCSQNYCSINNPVIKHIQLPVIYLTIIISTPADGLA